MSSDKSSIITSTNFIWWRGCIWFWIALLAIVLASLIYLFDRPLHIRAGDSYYGYTLGIISALGVLYLMWYGIRKRSYRSRVGTLQGTLSAHFWIGIALIFLVPLHAGFRFEANVHTLAYLVMLLTIISGFFGARNFTNLAPKIKSHRGSDNIAKMIERILILEQAISDNLLLESHSYKELKAKVDFVFEPKILPILSKQVPSLPSKEVLAPLLGKLSDLEQIHAFKMLELVAEKRELVTRLKQEVLIFTKLKSWIYLHIILSSATFVLLLIHIVTVLIYR